MLQYRRASIEDLEDITTLFRETITKVNARHYSPEEIKAWSEGADVSSNWYRRINDHYFIVGYDGDILVGMASIDDDGYLDIMYVHSDYQGRGIARHLLSMMESRAKLLGHATITSDVSITAKPFFESKGFVILRPQLVLCRGVVLRNYNVSKEI